MAAAPPKRVAVLGGTLSGNAAARRLAADGHRCELFRNLFDPARSIHTPHPLCEYQTATFVLRDDDNDAFKEDVLRWQRMGLIEEAPDFRAGRRGLDGAVTPSPAGGRRFRPKGGFQNLCDALCQDFAKSGGAVNPKQLSTMSWAEFEGQDGWWFEDIHGSFAGPFDVVLLAFDQLPRASRKASFKQLLESALPISEKVMACAGRALQASSMAAVVSFDPPLKVPWDTLVLDGVPELQMASRNPRGDQLHRGLKDKNDTWTLVSTTAWSFQTRPAHTGSWDKNRVGKDMVRAFGRVVQQDTSRHRMVVPTFHWQGASGITRIADECPPCIFDADASLGWCGDIFGGLGPSGAVASGAALAAECARWCAGKPAGVLPGEGAWVSRTPLPDDEDIMSIAGPSTARREPQDGCDHTWPAAAKLAAGLKIPSGTDSLARYRHKGILAQDRNRDAQMFHSTQTEDRASEERSQDVVASKPAAKRSALPATFSWSCEMIDDGICKMKTLPRDVRRDLLSAVFPEGARGVCGGLYDAKTDRIMVGDRSWHIDGPVETSWAELGLHGNHVVNWEQVESELLQDLLSAARASARSILSSALSQFEPDTIRVAFENMNGRRITRGQTLCGWSKDADHVEGAGHDLKALIMLGSSTVTIGFKYAKVDREALEVQMCPGDMLFLYGPARTWVSAVTGVDAKREPSAPFDFVHVWLCDHRQLKEKRLDTYRAIHNVKPPQKGDGSYKWMQYEYRVGNSMPDGNRHVVIDAIAGSSASSGRKVLLKGSDGQDHEGNANKESAVRPEQRGRRWKGRGGCSHHDSKLLDA